MFYDSTVLIVFKKMEKKEESTSAVLNYSLGIWVPGTVVVSCNVVIIMSGTWYL